MHMLRTGEDTETGRVLTIEAAGIQGRGQWTRSWKDVVEKDTRVMELEKVCHRDTWRRQINVPIKPC